MSLNKKIRKSLLKHQGDIVNAIVLIAIFLFLLSYFKPNLIFLDTTTSGGDTASHNYPLWYLKNILLPKGRLSGWSPGWYAGFPIFQFYFVMPFLLMVLLSYVFPLAVSFKIVTILGTFLLPIAAFAAMRLTKFKFPAPILAALFTLPFLFMEANSMWGGNIPSTLAGEFSYSLSLAFTVLFIGMSYRSVKLYPKSRTLVVLSALTFSLLALCHIYTAIFAAFASLFFLLDISKSSFAKRFCHLFKIYGLAFLICAFWILPLLAKVGYATPYHYVWNLKNLKEMFPNILVPFLLLSALGIYKSFKSSDNRIFYLIFSLVVSFILYKAGPVFGLTDVRFVSIFQLFPMFIAAYYISEMRIVDKSKLKCIPTLVIVVIVLLWVGYNVKYIDFWITWNYEGFQSKQHWDQLESLMGYLGELPDGRMVHEYSNSHDKFGTPRTFENIPLFSGKPTLEGLNIESALSSPYVFVIQAEISKTPTCPIPWMSCGSFNITAAETHLKLFNIRYIVATTEKLKNAIEEDTEWPLLKSFDEIEIYEVGNTNYASVPNYKPLMFRKRGTNWKELSLEWFKDAERTDVPIAFVENPTETDTSRFGPEISSLEEMTKIPLDHACEIFSEDVADDEIKIKTDCIGKPVLIKVSYFPNWQVEGADRIYLVSPSFMMVFPEQEDVRLYYGYTSSDYLGIALSIIGIFAAASLLAPGIFRKIKF